MTTAWIRPYDESGVVPGPRFKDLPASLPALFAGLAEKEPDAEAVVGPDGSWVAYRELFERATRVASGLARQGVRPGDRVAIRLGNEIGWCLAFLGASLAGAVAVPVNTRFTEAEAEYVVGDCAATFTVEPGRALPDSAPLVLDAEPDDCRRTREVRQGADRRFQGAAVNRPPLRAPSAQRRWQVGVRRGAAQVSGRAHLVRREALCCIPSSAGRDLEGGSWVGWLTWIRKVRDNSMP